MADAVKIRNFRPEDLKRLQDIAVEAWKPIYAEYRRKLGDEIFEQVFPGGSERKRGQVASFAEKSPERLLVAETPEGKVVGFATYYVNQENKVGMVGNNAVDRTAGLKGVGQALYAEVFRRMREEGMTLAKVETGFNDEGHAPARRAYERAGFGANGEHTEDTTYYKKL